jgi:hypothetical protein
MTVSVAEHCRRIKAHIAKGDKAVEKADEHYKAAGIYERPGRRAPCAAASRLSA